MVFYDLQILRRGSVQFSQQAMCAPRHGEQCVGIDTKFVQCGPRQMLFIGLVCAELTEDPVTSLDDVASEIGMMARSLLDALELCSRCLLDDDDSVRFFCAELDTLADVTGCHAALFGTHCQWCAYFKADNSVQ